MEGRRDAAGGETGTSSSTPGSSERRFPPAAQPEIMRAAEKDDQYAAFVHDACRDAFRHLFGTRVVVTFQNEIKLLGQTLYYLLTTGAGQQTLGEEYCDLSQVADSYGLPPTPARRIVFIFYQTVVPYLAERLSSRMTAHGMTMDDFQFGELHESNYLRRNQAQPSSSGSSSSRGLPTSAISKLKEKFVGLWFWAVQKWPMVLPFAREAAQLALRANLMFFYFEGLYYHISKRAAGIRYVFIGKPSNQRLRRRVEALEEKLEGEIGKLRADAGLMKKRISAMEGRFENFEDMMKLEMQLKTSTAIRTAKSNGKEILEETMRKLMEMRCKTPPTVPIANLNQELIGISLAEYKGKEIGLKEFDEKSSLYQEPPSRA
ncbi:hypothetical protein M5K25_005454 [Dendrobium thyrsiflorum]|uniref:RING-type E3 ubiquitin transferase n=1 Tax=Dendrobium thyrsiflorum TaxID=117978 RepID=A0ABD0VI03_DENTH